MPILSTLTAVALSAALTSRAAPAQSGPVEIHTRVLTLNGQGGDGMDADKDGFVSRQEFAAPMDRAFARLDKDGDGKLSKDELDADHGPMGAVGGDRGVQIFTLNGAAAPDGPDLDADKDGRVTEDEFLARIREAFRRMDKDGSGALEAGEHGAGSGVRIITRRVETGDGHAH